MKFTLSLLMLATLAFATSAYACGENAADHANDPLSAKSFKECAATKNYLNPSIADKNDAANDNGSDTSSAAAKAKGEKTDND